MEQIFALDIGTRLVMGLIMDKTPEGYEILARAQREHRHRAMYDGQIHDIQAVADAVKSVKDELECQIEKPIKKVSVAAAGRALKTTLGKVQKAELFPIVWEKEDIIALEMEGVQKALREIKGKEEDTPYHCVGYSVIESVLDGQSLTSLIGQRGKEVSITVIATFLPRTVIDGLTGVISRVGLEMRDLTLEPIAAGRAAIPGDMRRMNLVLVDVGAGTSDFGITRDGSFFAYGMVPMAGDEVTERICQQYLVDFQVGEKIKRSLRNKAKITFNDFLGQKNIVTRDEVFEVIAPVVLELAQKIADEILLLNGGSPHAVILIGGGSLTPHLPEALAEILNIPKNRVGIQVRERIQGVSGEKTLKGPDTITPIGIGISALEGEGLNYFAVEVNNTPVQIFELELATVSDALLAAGISPRLLVGRPGTALSFEVNGEMKIIKGTFGKSAQFYLNDREVKLDHPLEPGAKINFLPGEDGQDALLTFSQLLNDYSPKKILVNDQWVLFTPEIYCDGLKVKNEEKVPDGCKIIINPNETMGDLLRFIGEGDFEHTELKFKVNGNEQSTKNYKTIFINGEKADPQRIICDQDEVVIQVQGKKIQDLNLQPQPLAFVVNGKEINYPPQIKRVLHQGRVLSGQELLEDGMELTVEGYDSMPLLSELLPYVEVPQNVPSGARLSLKRNNQPAEFTTQLLPGDRIEIHWVKEEIC